MLTNLHVHYAIAQVKSMKQYAQTKHFDAAVKGMKQGLAKEVKFNANWEAGSRAAPTEGDITFATTISLLSSFKPVSVVVLLP